MCGICCVLGAPVGCLFSQNYICENSELSSRGPDVSSNSSVELLNGHVLQMTGHVLHIRGQPTKQPASHSAGNMLLWNGEIFGGIEVPDGVCDTEVLLNVLSDSDSSDHVLHTMARIKGPWAFIYWQQSTSRLWFGRDIFGRRSLLWHLPSVTEGDPFVLSSTQIRPLNFKEIPSVGIFCVDLSASQVEENNIFFRRLEIELHPWEDAVWPMTMTKVTADNCQTLFDPDSSVSDNHCFCVRSQSAVRSHMPKMNKAIPEDEWQVKTSKELNPSDYLKNLLSDEFFMSLTKQLISVLQKAVEVRVHNQPGAECGKRDLDKPGNRAQHASAENSVCREKLVSLDTHRVSDLKDDRVNCVVARNSSDHQNKSSIISDIEMDHGNLQGQTLHDISLPDKQKENVVQGCDISFVKETTLCGADIQHLDDADTIQGNAAVAILFSGGLDSSVLAALADRCLLPEESIDLINVAFEQLPKPNISSSKKSLVKNIQSGRVVDRWRVPDRITGYSALAELNPDRQWNFIEVNVTAEELKTVRSNHIRHLLYPLQTVLDDSIGCAVWFAARGIGILGNGPNKGRLYWSTTKVILCGMGADEQLAGYSRHRSKFMEEGFKGLVNEIEMEVMRISARNLGRDDRIITDHGKESRFPFLDEDVVSFLSQLPINYKADLSLPRGLGEKLLLRTCAAELGLTDTAVLPKRAIQFGSRIAKMENPKEKASDICSRLHDVL